MDYISIIIIFVLLAYIKYTKTKYINKTKYIKKSRQKNMDLSVEERKSPYSLSIKKEDEDKISYNTASWFKDIPLDKRLIIAKKFQNNFAVAVFNLNGSLNVGIIMRSSALSGCKDFYIIGRKVYDTRSNVGAEKYLNLHKIPDIILDYPDKLQCPEINVDKFYQFVIDKKLIPIFVEQGGISLFDFHWKLHQSNIPDDHKICFFFGNESHGIDLRFIKKCKNIPGMMVLTIPQIGILRSHNVSSSASIILWEYYRNILCPNYI